MLDAIDTYQLVHGGRLPLQKSADGALRRQYDRVKDDPACAERIAIIEAKAAASMAESVLQCGVGNHGC